MNKLSASLNGLQQAVELLKRGRLTEADAICARILREQPGAFNVLHLRGIIALQSGDLPTAEAWLLAATASDASQTAAWSNLAVVSLARQKPTAALQQAETALRLNAASAEAWANRGHACRALGHTDEALRSYDRAIGLAPELLDAHRGRGDVLLEVQRPEEALLSYRWILARDANHLDALNNAGVCLLKSKRFGDALTVFDRVLALAPASPQAYNNRGSALRRLGRPMDAAQNYRRALELQPNDAQVQNNLANALLTLGLLREALDVCDQALSITPALPDALNIRATILRDLGRAEEAADAYAALFGAAPHFEYALGNLLHARARLCDWRGGEQLLLQLLEANRAGRCVALPFSFLSMSDSASAQLRCAHTFVADRYVTTVREPSVAPRSPRIRLAYVSGDFGEHPVSYLLAGLFERHDRSRFEAIAISLRPLEPGSMSTRLEAAFSRIIDVSGLDTREVAALFAELQIDIAIDLAGFTAGARPELFAQRAAPVQVNYLGFPGTMGAEFMDYLIADDYVVPHAAISAYSEKIVHLPDCYQCFDDSRSLPPTQFTRQSQGLPADAFVFCTFNNIFKINAGMFDLWMHVLQSVAGSVMWFVAGRDSVRQNLSREAGRRGIDPSRLLFADRCPYAEHLARLPLADLFLDSLPFNAGATASDALSMGLPVLTISGEAFAARMAGSLLRSLGLQELIAHNVAEYVSTAIRLAGAPDELRRLRARLTAQRSQAPLFDTDRFRRHLEGAYEIMYEHLRSGQAPESFAVTPLD